MTLSSDLPIEAPDDDLFGLDPFARVIAKSIQKTAAPSGVVLAINGPWGSGKSSAVNLIRHHLKPAVDSQEIVVVPFNPWWFAGAESLTLAFFQQLSIAIGPSLSEQARESFGHLGQQISASGPLVAAIANIFAPGSGALASGAASFVGHLTGNNKTVEKEHEAIAKSLSIQKKIFLVIIDDIDRLSPDDALTIFRLVKSVGRLPNVIYLLAFDRELAERAVSERFPSEGRSYLDKIVQSAFEVPLPPIDVLRHQLVKTAVSILGEPDDADGVRLMNIFYDVIAPRITTPRDVVRIVNDLRSTWPAVQGEVDRADFFALSAIRVVSPKLHRAIRDNPNRLCGIQPSKEGGRQVQNFYDQLLGLDEMSAPDRDRERQGLRRLFPLLDTIWGNVIRRDDEPLKRQRRLASPDHFEIYFRFALPENVLSLAEINSLIARADDRDYVRARFHEELAKRRMGGSTRASLLLDELVLKAAEVEESKVAGLTAILFEMADELDVEGDEAQGFAIGDNHLRIHWLMNRLVTDRFSEAAREKIYGLAMESASLHWCCDFAERCLRKFNSAKDEAKRGEALVSEEIARKFAALALEKLRAAASSGDLMGHRNLVGLLFKWRRLGADEGVEVRAWTDYKVADQDFIVAMAKAIPSVSWSQGMGFDGMGDRVARRTVNVNLKPFQSIMNTDQFEMRVQELLTVPDLDEYCRDIIKKYHDAPRRSDD